jgi:hypothetical protein
MCTPRQRGGNELLITCGSGTSLHGTSGPRATIGTSHSIASAAPAPPAASRSAPFAISDTAISGTTASDVVIFSHDNFGTMGLDNTTSDNTTILHMDMSEDGASNAASP